ncbi:MAG TPA: hypothetical protein VF530_22835 [Planctomycetota bacterium]
MFTHLAPLAALVLSLGPTSAQNVRISGDLARATSSEAVQDFLPTRDGSRLVYTARPAPSMITLELFSRPVDASLPAARLNGPLLPQGTVQPTGLLTSFSFLLGADRVVFSADEEGDGVFELYSAPQDGSAPRTRLSEPGPTVRLLALDPAGTRALYVHRPTFSVYGALHVVPVDGSAPPLALWTAPGARDAWVTPDGTRVLFSVDAVLRERLYVTPLDGSGTPLELAITPPGAFTFGWYYADLVFPPGTGRALYHHTLEVDGDFERTLHSVPLDGSLPAVQIPGYANLAFDLEGASFVVDASTPPRVGFRSGSSIRSTLVDGSAPVTLLDTGTFGSWPKAFGTELFFSRSVAGGQTILRGPSDASLPPVQLFPGQAGLIEDRLELVGPHTLAFIHGSPISGGTAQVFDLTTSVLTPLHPTPAAGQGTLELIQLSGGQRMLLRGNLGTPGNIDLYAVPVDASQELLQLSQPLNGQSDVLEVEPVPGGARVAYRAQTTAPQSPTRQDLLVVPLDGSAGPLQINEIRPGAVVGDVTHFQATRDGRVLVYRADQVEDEHFDLYMAPADGSLVPRSLTASLPSVAEFALLEPGPWLVFRTATALYVARLDGAPPLQLDTAPSGFALDVALASDGARLVYRRATGATSFELRSRLLDGSSAPVRLHAPLPAQRTVTGFRLAADDSVVFRSDLAQDEVYELFAVPAKGGEPRRVSGALVTGGDVEDFQVDRDAKYVAYLADARVDRQVELFARELAGSQPPERRSGTLPATADVSGFAFAGDGRHLVFRANPVAATSFDLFSTPILSPLGPGRGPRRAGTEPIRLASGRAVQTDWSVSTDGASVLFRANPTAGIELFRVPVDGSTGPRRLSGPMVLHGAVSAFAEGGGFVVYRADQRVAGRVELWSVPVAGGTALPFVEPPDFADVTDFGLAPDGGAVAFLADLGVDGVLELHRAPIDASRAAQRVNGPLVASGDVAADFLVREALTLYRADQRSDEVLELFVTR